MNLDDFLRTIAGPVAEARAIDGRAVASILPPTEDALRVFDLIDVFDELVQAESNEARRQTFARLIVSQLA